MRGWLFGILIFPAFATAADPSPAEIARNSRERGSLNLTGLSAELRLTTQGKDAAPRTQTLTSTGKRIDGRLHSLARFNAPPAVAGITVLTVEGVNGEPSAVSMFLPKLRRIRKVAPGQRGEAFMSTDFSYADSAGSGAVHDDQMQRDADEVVDGRKTWVLRATPGGDSPYREVRVWVDQETFVPLKAAYTDRAGKPFKSYRAGKLKKFEDRVFASEAVMENLQTGSSTKLEVLEIKKAVTGDDAFTERALERG